jgi:hypothetical protein
MCDCQLFKLVSLRTERVFQFPWERSLLYVQCYVSALTWEILGTDNISYRCYTDMSNVLMVLFIQELHLRGNVFTEPLLSNGRLLSCDWPAPEMWAVPTSLLYLRSSQRSVLRVLSSGCREVR